MSRTKLPSAEIDGDLPGRRVALAAAPDADEQEGGDQREFVERVEEEQIDARQTRPPLPRR